MHLVWEEIIKCRETYVHCYDDAMEACANGAHEVSVSIPGSSQIFARSANISFEVWCFRYIL